MDNPCENERRELEEAEKNLQDHRQDALNLRENNPDAYDHRTKELRELIEKKKKALALCEGDE